MDGYVLHGLAWSSSGDLYYSADQGGTERWQVFVRHPDGRIEDFAVSDGDRVQHHMSRNAVAPDGKSVAISTDAREEADVDIAVLDAQSKEQRLLVADPAWHVAGGWSPARRGLCALRVAQNTDQDLPAVEVASGGGAGLTSHHSGMQNTPAGWPAARRVLAI